MRKPEFKASQYIHFKEAVTESLRRLENAHRKAENDKVYKKIKNIINFLTEIGQKLRKTLKNVGILINIMLTSLEQEKTSV